MTQLTAPVTTSDTRLHGRMLTLARIVSVALAIFYFGASLVTVPIKLSEMPQLVTSESGITAQEFLAGVARMGISPGAYIGLLQWLDVLMPLIYMSLGIFILSRKSDDWMALLTSFFLIVFLGPFDALAKLDPGWVVVSDWTAIFGSLLTILWFFLFPDGHFVPRAMRWLYLLVIATQVWRLFQPDVYQKNFPIIGLVIFGGILIAQVVRYRHAGAAQRVQIKWVIYGIILGIAPLLLFFILYLGFLNAQGMVGTIALNFFGNFLWYFFLIVLPISITIAILRSRLFDIDVIIRRTATYALVTALLVIVFFGSVVLLQQIFSGIMGSGQDEIVTVLSTLAIAALFVPLRRRIQNLIDRRFNRNRYDAQQVLHDFANTVRDETDLEKLTERLMQVVDETMQPESVSVWLKQEQEQKVGRP